MVIKCLIVEDAQFMREIYRYALAARPHIQIVGEAGDGEAAIRALYDLQPDIVLLDLVLPLKNGFEVLKEISNLSPKTKAIVVTSLEEEVVVQKAKSLGAQVYIKKPFTKQDLLTAFDEVTQSYLEVQNG